MIAYEREGQVEIITPVPVKGEAPNDTLKRVAKGIPPDAYNLTAVSGDLPDRSKRQHWAIENGRIVVRDGLPPTPGSLAPQATPLWSMQDLLKGAGAGEAQPENPASNSIEQSAIEPVAPGVEIADPVAALPAPAPHPIVEAPPVVVESRSQMPSDETSDEDKRAQAMSRITYTMRQACDVSADQQIRYEVAIQAHNGKHSALEMLSEEAGYLGMSAKSLAEHIIVERGLHEARVMRAHAKRAKAGV